MKAALTTTALRAVWMPDGCQCHRATNFTFWNGTIVHAIPEFHPVLAAISEVMHKHGYQPTLPDCGCCVCRTITGGKLLSLHGACACDINWLVNPYFSYPAPRAGHCDMPIAMTNEICALRTKSGAPLVGWGGNWRTIKDYMHFEAACTPADVASGIIGASTELSDVEKALFWVRADKAAWKKPFMKPGIHIKHPEYAELIKYLQVLFGLHPTGQYGVGLRNKITVFQHFTHTRVGHAYGNMNHVTWRRLIYMQLTGGRG